jgi:hypothetical protein
VDHNPQISTSAAKRSRGTRLIGDRSWRDDVGEPPREGAPTPLPGVQHAQQAAQLLEPVLAELRKDVREVRGHSRGEFILLLTAFGVGFLALAAMTIQGYRWSHEDLVAAASRLESKIDKEADQIGSMNSALVRIEQKFDDLTRPPGALPHR